MLEFCNATANENRNFDAATDGNFTILLTRFKRISKILNLNLKFYWKSPQIPWIPVMVVLHILKSLIISVVRQNILRCHKNIDSPVDLTDYVTWYECLLQTCPDYDKLWHDIRVPCIILNMAIIGCTCCFQHRKILEREVLLECSYIFISSSNRICLFYNKR